MIEKIENIQKMLSCEVPPENSQDITTYKVKYLGKKGLLTDMLKNIGKAPPEERKALGVQINELKKRVEKSVAEYNLIFKERNIKEQNSKESVDITLPGRLKPIGSQHPITTGMYEVMDIFSNMGFLVEEGPEIESDFYNFEALNMPADHPARDMQDTFYISDDTVLRTHTSPVQIHTMEKVKPPLKIIAPGKVYRCDSDVTHSPMFHQIEGFMVDYNITFRDLKGILELFLQAYFGKNTLVRFRPSFFPFTEPSAEVDIGCVMCNSSGCRICSNTGWLEILGSGMIDPAVFKSVGYDSEKFSGFAFGMGIERLVMLKYKIDDIRLFFDNNIKFLNQF